MTIIRLAIPSPLRRAFDYLPPADVDEEQLTELARGSRFRVPFGRRTVTGYLLEVSTQSDVPASKLREATELLDAESLLPQTIVDLGLWAAAYYHHPQGEVFGALFPRWLREGRPYKAHGEPGWQLTTQGRGLPDGGLRRSPKQAEAVAVLQQCDELSNHALQARGISSAVLRALRDKGLVERCTISTVSASGAVAALPGPALNDEQHSAVTAIATTWSRFSCHLLEGVTGSGKTEVYLRLIEDCIAQNKQALVLVPEIGLTPQTVARFEERFKVQVAVLHSGLTEAQRYQSWEAARSGLAPIVIGTRSAIFTPLARPGLLIVDEEHDQSYKQQDGFRYSARDVAVKRGQLESCTVLLGSATPSLESLHNALAGRYHHHHLTTRAGDAALPSVQLVDVRKAELRAGMSEQLLKGIAETLQQRQQVLLFLNRRGFAPTLQCHDCGWTAECPRCDARLTLHNRQNALRCHHCGARQARPARCPECAGDQVIPIGLGTERAESTLRETFPNSTILRVDSDSMQGRDSMAALAQRVNSNEPCILIGTQMLTKGHHFPNVTLVGVIDADALLFSADFRGEERLAQLLTQVAGRAGRAERPGSVLVQSHYPDHPLMQGVLGRGYGEQARELLTQRVEQELPPAGHIVLLHTDCDDERAGEDFLHEVRRRCASRLQERTRLIGPLPAPMQRRAGKHRFQLLLAAPDRRGAQQGAHLLVHTAEGLSAARSLRWSIDVDPQDLF